jgi:hypothetical protein
VGATQRRVHPPAPPGALFPDLLARTPVEIEVAGVLVWSGRITETPEQDGDSPAVGVQCEGWQYHLDDDVYERLYLTTRLDGWKDWRSNLNADLTKYVSAWTVGAESGVITIANAPAGAFTRGGVFLDLGNTAGGYIAIDWEKNQWAGTATAYLVETADPPTIINTTSTATIATLTTVTTSGTFTASLSGLRYLAIFCDSNVAQAQDRFFRVNGIRVFGNSAYQSAGASALTASTIVTDAITQATTQLSSDRSGIDSTVLTFPDFAPDGPRTPREQIAAANAPHNWITKIDERKRPIFKARPTSPLVEIGEWAGGDFANASSNSAEDIVTKVIVRGQGPDQQPLSATRTQTGTIVDRQGGVAAKILDSGFALTTTFAQALGDTYLLGHRTSPLKGQSAITVDGARRVQGGESVHPAHLLPLTGELMRLAHRTDPDTGAHSRTGTIAQVSYQHDTVTASVDIDNTRSDFEALQTRLGLVVPQ